MCQFSISHVVSAWAVGFCFTLAFLYGHFDWGHRGYSDTGQTVFIVIASIFWPISLIVFFFGIAIFASND